MPQQEELSSHGRSATPTWRNPLEVVRTAIKAVPAVKYALGVAGIMAALALGTAFFSTPANALLGAAAMLLLMSLLVVFAASTRLAAPFLQLPALFFTWAILILFVAAATLTMSSVFYKFPLSYPDLIQQFTIDGRSQTRPAEHRLDAEAATGTHPEHQQATLRLTVILPDEKTTIDQVIISVIGDDGKTYAHGRYFQEARVVPRDVANIDLAVPFGHYVVDIAYGRQYKRHKQLRITVASQLTFSTIELP